jgi:hypothetical protein
MDDLYSEIYGLRLLVFMEAEPNSNLYHQVLLSPEEFKKVSLSIGVETGAEVRPGVKEVATTTSEEVYTLPDLKQTHG